MDRVASRGMVVLADRYPKINLHGLSCGPLLQEFFESRWGLMWAIARWELGVCEHADDKNAPDLVVKLMVSPNLAISRKPNMDRDESVRRCEALDGLTPPVSSTVVVTVTDPPIGEVIMQVKGAARSLICGSDRPTNAGAV